MPFAAQINDVAPCANDVLRNDVMLCINEVALCANGKDASVQPQIKSGENIFFTALSQKPTKFDRVFVGFLSRRLGM